ncbi:cupin-like domain-containing protein [Chromatiaceae bacterium AAb-1]|nr:cupin-like domain-containing protein [Chromatiaceae bacterium AAb-1]
MLNISTQIEELSAASLPDMEQLQQQAKPVIIRELVADWPLVAAARQSEQAAADYLRRFSCQQPVQAFFADATANGRFFYNDTLDGFNFSQQQTTLEQVLEHILQLLHSADTVPAPTFYMGSTTLDYCVPGLKAENPLPLALNNPLISLWVGNKTKVVAHYDVPDNIACVAAGKRRFTLFPPSQTANLYPGPLEFTPAGQPVSMVNFEQPDLQRYPHFADALEQAQVAELQAGDAIFIPSMWWHAVDGLSPLNILINYWWRQSPSYMGLPADALFHAILSVRDLPVAQRKVWQQLFEHYVFNADESTAAHLPPDKRGMLGDMTGLNARRIRALLLQKLNR